MDDCPTIPTSDGDAFFQSLLDRSPDKRLPLSGTFEITYRCNVRCVHCYVGDSRFSTQENELSTAEIKDIIDQIVAEGCLRLLITGGEPFLRPDLFEVIEYAKKKGLLVTLFTNGTMVTPANIQKLKEFPPNSIEITLYGLTQATYEAVTGIPGSHARCMQGIELILNAGLPLKLKTMVLTINQHELEGILDFANERNVEFRYDVNVHAANDQQKSPHAYRVAPDQVIQLDKIDPNRFRKLKETWQERKMNTDWKYLYHCGAGIKAFHINPYGMLSLCITSKTHDYSLRTGNFREGWQTFLPKVRYQPMPVESQCTSCSLYGVCKQCPAVALLENDNPAQPVNFLCQVTHLREKNFSQLQKMEEIEC